MQPIQSVEPAQHLQPRRPVAGSWSGRLVLPRHMLFGGDYNPEQWDDLTLDHDLEALEQAGVNTLTLNVFGWAAIQSGPQEFHLERLDALMDQVTACGMQVILGTATAALPPWLVAAEPTTMRVDFQGRRHGYGQRHHFCPTSPAYRSASRNLVHVLAARYAGHPGLLGWHVGNEYGGACYCQECTQGFRRWLLETHGSLDALNHNWCTQVWSHVLTDIDQVPAPNALTEHWGGPYRSGFPVISLEYRRFMTQVFSECLEEEIAEIRRLDTVHPVTANLMGPYEHLDYYRFARSLDVVSWDNYPRTSRAWPEMAFNHSLMRAVAPGRPMWLMEQAPVATTCREVNAARPPGVMGLWSHQAVAQGADAVLAFQMRTAPGGPEMWFEGVLDHRGRTDTRAYLETQQLGRELAHLGELVGSRVQARCAVILDWDSWWYSRLVDGHSDHLSVPGEAQEWHEALSRHLGGADVTDGRSDMSGYEVVVAACLYMAHDQVIDNLLRYVRGGGRLVVGPMGFATASTGRVLIDSRVDELLGCEVEERDARDPEHPVLLRLPDGSVDEARHTLEILRPTSAKVIGTWASDWLAGSPAVTSNVLGRGQVLRLGASLSQAGRRRLLSGLIPPAPGHPLVGEMEHTVRSSPAGTWDILLNHDHHRLAWRTPYDLTDLRSGEHISAGQDVALEPGEARYLRQDAPRRGVAAPGSVGRP